MKRIVVAPIIGFALLLAACAGVAADPDAEPLSLTQASTPPFPSSSATVPAGEGTIEQVVRDVLPAVVNVVSEGRLGQGEGSGFIVREDGIVVTNYHVVENATSVRVLTSDEEPEEYEARVIGGDAQADLAVLDIDATGLPTVPLGDSDALSLGQQVVAIGYALGLEGGPSVTSGIVSSLTRQITVPDPGCGDECLNDRRIYTDVVQTDAAINPGNSGGPLVDLAGNVVGINTAGNTSAENVGFAIQINSVRPTIVQSAENPDRPVAFLGIGADDADGPAAAEAGLNPPVDEGALIFEVVSGGPAAEAGIRPGDVIVTFDGEPIRGYEELGEAIRAHSPGDEVEIEVVRSSGERDVVTAELGVNPVPVG